jgi:hypothetical protein
MNLGTESRFFDLNWEGRLLDSSSRGGMGNKLWEDQVRGADGFHSRVGIPEPCGESRITCDPPLAASLTSTDPIC